MDSPYRSPMDRPRVGEVPLPPSPALATEFEPGIRKLQLKPDMYTSSRELRAWCERNRNRVYIPEWLLSAMRRLALLLFSPLEYPDPYFLIPDTPEEPTVCLAY